MSAPCGQPPLCRRVGFASGSLAPCLHSATLHFARSLRSDMFSCCSFVALVLSLAIYVYLGLWVSLRLICFSSFVGFVPSCAHNDRTCFIIAPRPCSAGFAVTSACKSWYLGLPLILRSAQRDCSARLARSPFRRRPSLHSLRSFRCGSPSPPPPAVGAALRAGGGESGIFICAVCRWRGSAFFALFA